MVLIPSAARLNVFLSMFFISYPFQRLVFIYREVSGSYAENQKIMMLRKVYQVRE